MYLHDTIRMKLNISPTMVIPGDHCDMPPKSEWLNWAMVPPPDRSARNIVRTASVETEWRMETRSINASSFNGIASSLIVQASRGPGYLFLPTLRDRDIAQNAKGSGGHQDLLIHFPSLLETVNGGVEVLLACIARSQMDARPGYRGSSGRAGEVISSSKIRPRHLHR